MDLITTNSKLARFLTTIGPRILMLL